MKHEYETVFLVKPDLTPANLAKVQDKVDRLFQKDGVEILTKKDWGKRKLAYRIGQSVSGQYYYYHFSCPGDFIGELENILKIDELILRFMTVRLEPHVVDEKGKQRVSEAEEAQIKREDRPMREYYRRPVERTGGAHAKESD